MRSLITETALSDGAVTLAVAHPGSLSFPFSSQRPQFLRAPGYGSAQPTAAFRTSRSFKGYLWLRDLRVSLPAQRKATAWTAGDQITWTGPGAQAEEYRKAVHARDR
jgi:hypothetical protein